MAEFVVVVFVVSISTSSALNTGRSSSPTKSDYQFSLPDTLCYQLSSLAAPPVRSRSPYRKSWDGDVNARTRSPLNSKRLVNSSPRRRGADLASFSPNRLRASSPDIHTAAAASRFARHRSPDSYRRSPDRSRLKSMSPARLNSPDRLPRGQFSSVPRFELYGNTSENAYSRADTSAYYEHSDGGAYLPYKSYSHPEKPYSSSGSGGGGGVSTSDYRPATWANTRELASAADKIMEKYYPRSDSTAARVIDSAQSDSKVSGKSSADNSSGANQSGDDVIGGGLTPMRLSRSDSMQTEQFDIVDKLRAQHEQQQQQAAAAEAGDNSINSGTGSAAAGGGGELEQHDDGAGSVTSQKSAAHDDVASLSASDLSSSAHSGKRMTSSTVNPSSAATAALLVSHDNDDDDSRQSTPRARDQQQPRVYQRSESSNKGDMSKVRFVFVKKKLDISMALCIGIM